MTEEERLGMLYPIHIVPYNFQWPEWFLQEKARLSSLLGNRAQRIEHMGSTAIPGLAAKPTIDILIELSEQPDNASIIPLMTEAGYRHMKEQTEHLMFVKGYGESGLQEQSFHVHMGPSSQGGLWDRLLFRDYLRQHPDIAQEYASLKMQLAHRYRHLREHYTAAKTDFIVQHTRRARAIQSPCPQIRVLSEREYPEALSIINDAASAYKGVIPDDRWHEPYMNWDEFLDGIRQKIDFWCWADEDRITGVMGIQEVADVSLIRHAYVRTAARNSGIGGRLLEHLLGTATRPVLVGTWTAADWAIAFYQKHGFSLVPPSDKEPLLRHYWGVPDRQIETSVVLADSNYKEARSWNRV